MTANPLPPGLMLVHGNQPETLRDLLVTWMRRYPLAPLEPEIILAQSNGIAQWLKLALAEDAEVLRGATSADPEERERREAERRHLIESILSAEKPAHTRYTLHVETV